MRLKIEKVDKKALTALLQLEEYLGDTLLTKKEKHLIKIRASQINGCAFCINMHVTQARKEGEPNHRLDLICAWREAHFIFNHQEQLMLEITEEITMINKNGLCDALYDKSIQYFGEKKTAQIIMAIIIINSWNRLCVSLRNEIVF